MTSKSFTPPKQRKVYTADSNHPPLGSGTSCSSLSSTRSSISSSNSKSDSNSNHRDQTITTSKTEATLDMPNSRLPLPELSINTDLVDGDGGGGGNGGQAEENSPVTTLDTSSSNRDGGSSGEEERIGTPMTELENEERGSGSEGGSCRKAFGGSRFVEDLDHDVTDTELQAFLHNQTSPKSTAAAIRFLAPAKRDRRHGPTHHHLPFSPGRSPLSPSKRSSLIMGFSSSESLPISPISPLSTGRELSALHATGEEGEQEEAESKEVLVDVRSDYASSSFTGYKSGLTHMRPGPSRSSTTPESIPTLRTIHEMTSNEPELRRMSVNIVSSSPSSSSYARNSHQDPNPISNLTSAQRREPPPSPSKKRPLSGLFRRSSISQHSSRKSSISSATSVLLSPNLATSERKGKESLDEDAIQRHQRPKSPHQIVIRPRSSSMQQAPSGGGQMESPYNVAELAGGKPDIVVTDVSTSVPEQERRARRSSIGGGWKKLWGAVGGNPKEVSPPPRLRKMSKVEDLNSAVAEHRPELGVMTTGMEDEPITTTTGSASPVLPALPRSPTMDPEQWLNNLKSSPSPARYPEIVEQQHSTTLISRSGTIISSTNTIQPTSKNDLFNPFIVSTGTLETKLAQLHIDRLDLPASASVSVPVSGPPSSDGSGLNRRKTMMVSARLGQAPKKRSAEDRRASLRATPAPLQRRHTAPITLRGPSVASPERK